MNTKLNDISSFLTNIVSLDEYTSSLKDNDIEKKDQLFRKNIDFLFLKNIFINLFDIELDDNINYNFSKNTIITRNIISKIENYIEEIKKYYIICKQKIYLENLNEQYSDKSRAITTGMQFIRIPVSGGDLFVSADDSSPAAKGLQADLNAAANIGLKALLDPDWEGKWWFVPCASVTNTPVTDKVKGSQVISNVALIPIVQGGTKSGRSKAGKKERDVVNLWRDPSSLPIKADGNWFGSVEYWNKVRIRVIDVIKTKNNLAKLTSTQDTPW